MGFDGLWLVIGMDAAKWLISNESCRSHRAGLDICIFDAWEPYSILLNRLKRNIPMARIDDAVKRIYVKVQLPLKPSRKIGHFREEPN